MTINDSQTAIRRQLRFHLALHVVSMALLLCIVTLGASHPASVAERGLIEVVANMPPVGSIVAYGGEPSDPPEGWLFCHGQALSKANYPELFSVIGFHFTRTEDRPKFPETFRLPDLKNTHEQGLGTSLVGVAPDYFSKHEYYSHYQPYVYTSPHLTRYKPGDNRNDDYGRMERAAKKFSIAGAQSVSFIIRCKR